jgi:hypothetical protein
MTLVILGGSALFLHFMQQGEMRDPDDVVWMERVRHNSLEQVAPLRDLITFPRNTRVSIVITSEVKDDLVSVAMTDSERELALGVINAARNQVLETSEWIDQDARQSAPAPGEARRLFEIKDCLWEITLKYLDILRDIFSARRPVSASEVVSVEGHLDSLRILLESELARLGYGSVE